MSRVGTDREAEASRFCAERQAAAGRSRRGKTGAVGLRGGGLRRTRCRARVFVLSRRLLPAAARRRAGTGRRILASVPPRDMGLGARHGAGKPTNDCARPRGSKLMLRP